MFQLIPLITLVGFILKAVNALSKKTPKSTGLVSSETLYDLLDKYMAEESHPKMTDSEYKIYDTSEVDKIVGLFVKQGHKYSEDFDCDNFAFSLYSYMETCLPRCMFGVEFVKKMNSYHALNTYIDKDMNKWYVEPQTGERLSAELGVSESDWSLM